MKSLLSDILPPIITRKLLFTRSQLKYFRNSKGINSRSNDRLKGTRKNDRCFIIGTGPSIKQQDLTLLKDEYVIGVSGLFQHKDIQTIHPNYYVLPPIFSSHKDYYEEENFINWLKNMDKSLSDETTMFFDVGDKVYIDKYKLFSNKKIIWTSYRYWQQKMPIAPIDILSMPAIWSVSESAIQVALYLGFSHIYILGFDHSWFNDIWAHFTDDYLKDFDPKKVQKCKEWVDSEHEMIRHSFIFNKYKKLYALENNIYNVNAEKNSYVDTFPKINYESLFHP